MFPPRSCSAFQPEGMPLGQGLPILFPLTDYADKHLLVDALWKAAGTRRVRVSSQSSSSSSSSLRSFSQAQHQAISNRSTHSSTFNCIIQKSQYQHYLISCVKRDSSASTGTIWQGCVIANSTRTSTPDTPHPTRVHLLHSHSAAPLVSCTLSPHTSASC